MSREITIPETTIVVQKRQTAKGVDVIINSVTDDGGCVMASWQFAGQSFNDVLWDENTTPSYKSIGDWVDKDVNLRITELINQNK